MEPPVLAEIFSQGDEVVTGQITDTNAAWLAQNLRRLGFDVARHTSVGDRLERLAALLLDIAARADCCICSGGLGPTVDDLTTAAVAQAFGLPLELDTEALQQIEGFFVRRGYAMPGINRKQAMLPRGAQRIDNHSGTAPGFALRHGRCFFAFLPGVPAEMQAMFGRHVEPMLIERFRLQPDQLVIFRTFGLGESSLQERLDGLTLPASVRLGFRAVVPENEVKVLFPAGYPGQQARIIVDRTAQLLGDALVSIDGAGHAGGDLTDVCARLLLARKATLAIAETGSGGQLAWRCRGRPWLVLSLVGTDAERLGHALDLKAAALPSEPEQVARTLATRLQVRSGARYALVNVAQRPEHAADAFDQPPATAALALAGPDFLRSSQHSITGSPDRQRRQIAALSLDLLRRALTEGASGLETA